MIALQRLDICAVRGIKDLSLDFDGGSIVLGGGNGTGKSACVDAIEFLYTGKVDTLSGTAGLSLRQHGAHIGSRPGDARVTATFDASPPSVTRWLSGKLDVPLSLEAHMERGARVPFILRRSQLQHFIHAKPADRYRSMADLIGADELERTEMALKRARDELDRSCLALDAQLAQVEAQILHLPVEEGDEAELLADARETLESLGFEDEQLGSREDIDGARGRILRSLTRTRPDPRREGRARLAHDLERGIGQARLRQALDAYLTIARGGSGAPNRSQMLELLQLLQRGREYLSHTTTGQCPLCRQPVESRQLLRELVGRVAQLEEVSLHQQNLDRARDNLMNALQDSSARLRTIEPLYGEAGERNVNGSALLNSMAMVRESVRSGALTESVEMASRLEDTLAEWEGAAGVLQGALAEAGEDEGSDSAEDPAALALGILEELKMTLAAMGRSRTERARLVAEQERLAAETARARRPFHLADIAYRTFTRIKNKEIQDVYDALRSDLARMYDTLHPGEGHAAVAIAMDPRKRGSSDLKMDFHGRTNEDPRAFASEGHLDSLGVCIFLAFARRFTADWPLLVLDDVVTSVDAAHKRRVARLLYEEFGDKQLLITTHDSRWFADLARVQAELGHGKSRNLVIESWSLETGPRIREQES